MICRRRLITAIIGAFLVSVVVRAEMVPICHFDIEHRQDSSVCVQSENPPTNQSGLYGCSILDDFGLKDVQIEVETDVDAEPPAQTPPMIELTGGPCSASLCLYALMGLGLCSAPHWIKRLSFSHIPEWYHDGGPFQIGHSFAATPESLCTLQVCNLEPPDDTAEDFLPQYRLKTIVSSWRKTQFTPDVIASRGPPDMS